MPRLSERTLGAGLLLGACLLFLAHASMFYDWIIDDAGITFAYARNFADGHGLVSQPGLEPVEGYSNFLWLLLIAPFIKLGLFDPIVTPKLLSVALVFGSFWLLHSTLSRLPDPRARRAAWLAPLLLAANPPFVIWTTSGLENPILVFLLSASVAELFRAAETRNVDTGRAVRLGVLAAAMAMTRPDGVVFVAVLPLVAALMLLRDDDAFGPRPVLLRSVAAYGLSFVLLFGAFIAFRLLYFEEVLPNTYYAKGTQATYSSTLELPLAAALKMGALTLALPGGPLFLLVLGAAAWRVWRRWQPVDVVLAIFCLLAVVEFVALPWDWMKEFRFATPFVVVASIWAALLFAQVAPEVQFLRRGRVLRGAFVIVLVLSFLAFSGRSQEFAEHPSTPFDSVERRFATRFDGYAVELGVQDASVMMPDIGATLYYSRLRAVDLGGLADKTIARTLTADNDRFRNYVFDEMRPTFIVTHSEYTEWARLDADPRFRWDYAAICENEYIRDEPTGVMLYSGAFVRRDAVAGPQGAQWLNGAHADCGAMEFVAPAVPAP